MSLKEKRRRERGITLMLAGALALSIVACIATVARIPETKITKVSVSQTAYVHQGALEQVAKNLLTGTHLFLIPRSHTFFAPLSSIRKEIEVSFPAVKSASVKRNTMRALAISIIEQEPSFLWCRDDAFDGRECFYMNSDGYVFARVEGAQNNFVQYSGGIEGDPIGVFFLDGAFTDLHATAEQVASIVAEEVGRVLVDAHDDVTITFKSGAELIFVRTAHKETLLDAIASVFSVKRVHEKRVLEYADFRFGNRIFVKFEGDN